MKLNPACAPLRSRRIRRAVAETLERRHLLASTGTAPVPMPPLGGHSVAFDLAEVEPNDSAGTAQAVTVSSTPNTITGSIANGTDVDFYSFTLGARSGVFFDIDSRDIGLSATLDSIVTVYDASGAVVQGANDDGRDFDTFTLNDTASTGVSLDSSLYLDLNAGSYAVRVSGFGSSTGSYQFKLASDNSYTATVPVFNSVPGAADTLYLDFDGHSASDDWGTYTIAPYDISGNAAEWTPLERLAIQNVWRGISEDFAPFNINITTNYAGPFTDGVAFRQVIGNSNGSEVGATGALGVSFVGAYGGFGSGDNTNFVFVNNFPAHQSTESSTGAMNSDRAMARAIEMANTGAHEFGHALGLRHYGGTNPQNNAIMHTPDFGLSRERWVSGNTKSDEAPVVFQDDVAIISNGTNTFGYKADDHGDSTGAATVLSAVGSTYTGTGIIGTTADNDYFRFSGNGSTSILLDIPEHIGNLDGEIVLYNSVGAPLASADGTFLSSLITFSLPGAGDYYVQVRSDAGPGEIGQYTLRITTTVGGGGGGTISGKTFRDVTLNNIYEPGAGDAVLSGVTVYLDNNNNNILDGGEPSTTSDGSGNYSFTSLADNSYNVREVPPSGYINNLSYNIIISGGNTFTNVDFGNFPIVYPAAGVSSSGADTYTVRLNAVDNTKIEILESLGGGPVTTYTTNKALIPSLTFNTGALDDLVTVDYSNTNPLPPSGIIYDGGTNTTFDRVSVIGSNAADTINLQHSGVLTGAGIIGVVGVERATVNGNDGNDTLTTGVALFAVTTFNGGNNTDTFTYNASEGNDTVTVTSTTVGDGSFIHSFSAIEGLIANARFSTDTINLNSSNIPVTLNGGDGTDTINIGTGAIDTITAAVVVNGDAGTDTININDSVPTFADTYTITSTNFSRTVFAGLSYATAEALIVNAQGGNNTINVNSTATATPVTVNGGGGNDTFNIGGGNLDNLPGAFTANGGSATDTVNVNDASAAFSDNYNITSTTVSRVVWGGLTYGTAEGLVLNAQPGSNNMTLTGTAAATPVTVNGNNGNDILSITGAPSAPVTFNGGTNASFTDTLNVNAGNYTFNADAVVGTAKLILNVNNAGSTVTFNASQHLTQLNINTGGVATMTTNGSRQIVTDTLTIGTGKLNLQDNDLIVKLGDIGSWNGSNYTGILGLVQSGYAGGAWSGNGIVTAQTDAISPNVLTTLATATAGQATTTPSGSVVWQGETVSVNAVLVKYTFGGDANLDGTLNGDDYFQIDSNIGLAGSSFGYYNGDFNYDGDLNGDDYFIIDSNIAIGQAGQL